MHSSDRVFVSSARHVRAARIRIATGIVVVALVNSCASGGTSAASTTTSGTTPATSTSTVGEQQSNWPVVSREHVDLWLHGYAVLTRDTATVPYFQRGYRERIPPLKTKRNVLTQLDANRDKLAARFVTNPNLVSGQFVPLYFDSWATMKNAISAFLQADGDPRATNDPVLQSYFLVLASSFQSAADRDWLRLFTQALDDERNRFYLDYWNAEQRERADARRAVDSLWQRVYRSKFQRFLNNTQQQAGELYLSLPLDGEGRTVSLAKRQNAVAVEFPSTADSAIDAIYVFAHEIVNAVTNTAINDNTTPAEQRSGVVGAYSASATVRGGALLLQRIAPELVSGYMRFYLRSANRAVPTADPTSAFQSTFAIPDAIRDAIAKQLDVVLGGI
jgi:hypothetical protein